MLQQVANKSHLTTSHPCTYFRSTPETSSKTHDSKEIIEEADFCGLKYKLNGLKVTVETGVQSLGGHEVWPGLGTLGGGDGVDVVRGWGWGRVGCEGSEVC